MVHVPSSRRSLRIGCGEWGFRDLPMRRHFEIARDFGIRVLEFGIGGGRVGRLSEAPSLEEIAEFLRLGSEFGIATPFCCIENDFTLADSAAHAAMLDKVLGQMRSAATCRATHVRLFAGFTPLATMTEALWSQLLAALAACDAQARRLGLTIAIETHGAIASGPQGEAIHQATVTTDRQALERLLREMPSSIGINYDPGNIKAAEHSSTKLHLEVVDERVNYCHLKDWRRVGEGWEACGVGDDDLDYPALLSRMRFEGVYLIEYEPLHDTEEGIRRSLETLKNAGFSLVFE